MSYSTDEIQEESFHEAIDPKWLIEMRNVDYKIKQKYLLKNINLTFLTNQIVAVMGHNGAGKSTLIKLVAGILNPSYGYIYRNQSLSCSTASSGLKIGYCPQQHVFVSHLTLRENIELAVSLKLHTRDGVKTQPHQIRLYTDSLLEKTKIKREDETKYPHQLSTGTVKKLSMAMSLAADPPLLLLDEPTSGVDSDISAELQQILKKLRRRHSIILISQNYREIEQIVDRYIILSHGQIAFHGSKADLLVKYASLGAKLAIRFYSFQEEQLARAVLQAAYPRAYSRILYYRNILEIRIPYRNKQARIVKVFKSLKELRQISVYFRTHNIEDCVEYQSQLFCEKHNCGSDALQFSKMNLLLQQANFRSPQKYASICRSAVLFFKARVYAYYRNPVILVVSFLYFVIYICYIETGYQDKFNYAQNLVQFSVYAIPLMMMEFQSGRRNYIHSNGITHTGFWIGSLLGDFTFYGFLALLQCAYYCYNCALSLTEELYLPVIMLLWAAAMLPICHLFVQVFPRHYQAMIFVWYVNDISQALVNYIDHFIFLFPQPLGWYGLFALLQPQKAKSSTISHYIINRPSLVIALLFVQIIFWTLVLMGIDLLRQHHCSSTLCWNSTKFCFSRKSRVNKLNDSNYQTSNSEQNLSADYFRLQESRNISREKSSALSLDSRNLSQFQLRLVVSDLNKHYSRSAAPSIKGVNLRVMTKEIAVVVGENASGKSTLFNILTQKFKETSGSVVYNSFQKNKYNKFYRKQISFCRQKNIYWDNLTVAEQIILLAELKGYPTDQSQQMAFMLMHAMEIYCFKDLFPHQLSSGSQRKLCLSLSFIGNFGMLVEDEPTTGLDSMSRNKFWYLVKYFCELQKDRVALICTHNEEEALMFSDTISIMSQGDLVMTTETARALCFLAKIELRIEVGRYIDIIKIGQFDRRIRDQFGYSIQRIDYMIEERREEQEEERKRMKCSCVLEIRADHPFRILEVLFELQLDGAVVIEQFGTSLVVF